MAVVKLRTPQMIVAGLIDLVLLIGGGFLAFKSGDMIWLIVGIIAGFAVMGAAFFLNQSKTSRSEDDHNAAG